MQSRMIIALGGIAALGLSACGGSSPEPLTQEQINQAMLTQEDFPLEGFTAGEVAEGDVAEFNIGSTVVDFPGLDQLDRGCQEAIKALGDLEATYSARSRAEFTGSEGADSPTGPPTVMVAVAAVESGDDQLARAATFSATPSWRPAPASAPRT